MASRTIPTDPDTIYAGVEDAALFRSVDGAKTWEEPPALRDHDSAPSWQPGAGGMCLHTVVLDPANPDRIFVAISAAGVFRTDDGGKTWRPVNRGLRSGGIPDSDAEAGHWRSPHCDAPVAPRGDVHAEALGLMRSDDAGESWREVSGNLPSDFGFPIEVHAQEPETIYVVPIKSDSECSETRPGAVELLDELPIGEALFTSAPIDVLRQLFQTFRLEVRFDKPSHRANCQVTIDEDSVAVLGSNSDEHAVSPGWCTDVGSAPGRERTRRERARPGISADGVLVVGGFQVPQSPWAR